jgi:hypothetical protein
LLVTLQLDGGVLESSRDIVHLFLSVDVSMRAAKARGESEISRWLRESAVGGMGGWSSMKLKSTQVLGST